MTSLEALPSPGWLGIDVGVWAAVLAILAAVATFVAGELIKARDARRERRRAVAEEWLRYAHALVESPSLKLRDRSVGESLLALSVSPKQSVVASWVHEMMLDLARLNDEANSAVDNRASQAVSMQNFRLAELGSGLIRWHHGDLRPLDFWIPYKLHALARWNKTEIQTLADQHRLAANLTPFRYRLRHRLAMILSVGVDVDNEWWLFYPALSRSEKAIVNALRWWPILRSPLLRRSPQWLSRYLRAVEAWRLRLYGPAVRKYADWAWSPNQLWPPGASAGV